MLAILWDYLITVWRLVCMEHQALTTTCKHSMANPLTLPAPASSAALAQQPQTHQREYPACLFNRANQAHHLL